MRQAVPVARSDNDQPGGSGSPGVELLEGFGDDGSAVAERDPHRARVLGYGLGLIALVVVIGMVAAWFGDRADGGSAEEVSAPAETDVPQESGAPSATTMPAAVPRPDEGPGRGVADLPGARPGGELTGLTAEGDVFRLDLVSGWWEVVDMGPPLAELFDLDGVLMGRAGRRLVRVDPERGTSVEVASGSTDVLRAHGPSAVVMVERDENGVVARVLGADGVFRGGSRLPGEAVVHGAVNDRIVVTMAGQVVLVGADESVVLGTGRVLALGDNTVVRVDCALGVEAQCQLLSTDLGGGIRHVIAVPALLAGASPGRWSDPGLVSPDGQWLAVPMSHGNGSVRGLVAVDLATGQAHHSPEMGLDLGKPAWSPDSAFLMYPFERDLMVWEVAAASQSVSSGRAIVRQELTEISLR